MFFLNIKILNSITFSHCSQYSAQSGSKTEIVINFLRIYYIVIFIKSLPTLDLCFYIFFFEFFYCSLTHVEFHNLFFVVKYMYIYIWIFCFLYCKMHQWNDLFETMIVHFVLCLLPLSSAILNYGCRFHFVLLQGSWGKASIWCRLFTTVREVIIYIYYFFIHIYCLKILRLLPI